MASSDKGARHGQDAADQSQLAEFALSPRVDAFVFGILPLTGVLRIEAEASGSLGAPTLSRRRCFAACHRCVERERQVARGGGVNGYACAFGIPLPRPSDVLLC